MSTRYAWDILAQDMLAQDMLAQDMLAQDMLAQDMIMHGICGQKIHPEYVTTGYVRDMSVALDMWAQDMHGIC